MLNITDVDIPQEKVIEIGSQFATPMLIMLLVFVFLVFAIIGILNIKESKGKFFAIWTLSLVISIIILVAIILLPATMYNFTQYLIKLFG